MTLVYGLRRQKFHLRTEEEESLELIAGGLLLLSAGCSLHTFSGSGVPYAHARTAPLMPEKRVFCVGSNVPSAIATTAPPSANANRYYWQTSIEWEQIGPNCGQRRHRHKNVAVLAGARDERESSSLCCVSQEPQLQQ